VEALGVAARVERQYASVDVPLAQRRQKLEEMLLGTADPGHLDQMENLHRARIRA
jgi:hypothetical protein